MIGIHSPAVKGWCPGAYRPMMSGDGLIVRVKPRLCRITRAQGLALCDISRRFGNGVIDLTSRANLQLRGVAEDQHQQVLDLLLSHGLLDDTPEDEQKRSVIVTPLWQADDLNVTLHDAVCVRLDELPLLPPKMGIAIDAGDAPVLGETPADFRFERGTSGLILRADGMAQGREVTEETAIDALIDMANWFVTSGGVAAKRMARHVNTTPPCEAWQMHAPRPSGPRITPGGPVFGAAFGSLDAQALTTLITQSDCTGLRVTPWRMFILEDANPSAAQGFITAPGDPLMHVHACPGAPACAASTVETRKLARLLAPDYRDGLHVSGCAKGCAYPKMAATTLVGRDGTYDLVENGHPWDHPAQTGLMPAELIHKKT
ncbi:MAG: cobalamin biosynthesis protein CobG [Sulfitobacter sp.]